MASVPKPLRTGDATPYQNKQHRDATTNKIPRASCASPTASPPPFQTAYTEKASVKDPVQTASSPPTPNYTKTKQMRIQFPFPSDKEIIQDRYYGTDHTNKLPNHYRFVFNNINGIQLSTTSLRELTVIANELQADWLGLAETHIDTQKQHVRNKIHQALSHKQYGFKATNCVFSQSDMDYGGERKFGGVLQIATNNLASRTITTHSDKYGRWSSQTHAGKRGTMLTTISAYRVIDGCKGPASAYSQQRAMLVTANREANPRRVFITDMIAYIHQCQSSGHEIILCLDANETMSAPNSAIRRLAAECGLVDVHQNTCPDYSEINSHRSGSSQIDFCLVTPRVMECISQTGILGFDEAFGGDHRAMYFDMDIECFFKGITTNPVSFTSRDFTTKDIKKTKEFTKAVEADWTHRKLTSRIALLSTISKLPPNAIRRAKAAAMFEKLDNEITLALKTATNSLQTPNQHKRWSPKWAKAGAEKRYWLARIKNAWAGRDGREVLDKLRIKYNIEDDGNNDLSILQHRYDMAIKTHSYITKRDVDYREHHLDQMIETKTAEAELDTSAKRELAALKSLKRAEQQSKVFQKIGHTLKPFRSGGISRVEIPVSMSTAMQAEHAEPVVGQLINTNATLREVLQRTIRTKKKDGTEEWVTILDKDQLENAILLYCQEHFQQASTTPFGHGHFAELLGISGLTEAGQNILDGTLFADFDEDTFPELATFLAELAMPEEIKQLAPISQEITVADWHKGFSQWRESTSTSPSGRHLGMYKALLPNSEITESLCEMLNIVIRLKLTPKRWCRAISVLLEKDPGSPCVNRLRVIHLFEADYNFFLKLMWASRLVHRGEDTNQLGSQQYGSRARLSALDPTILKRLTYDLSRILRSNLGTFDNDAKSCYDRIINSIAMIAAQRLGMSAEAIAVHAGVLWAMQYSIKTMYGVSEGYYQSTKDATLFGTGQGSGASPAAWLTISIVLLSSLQRMITRGMRFATPSGFIEVERLSDAFVDDTQNGINDAHLPRPMSLGQLIRNLEHMAQTWERLLFSSGGALELTKCFYCIVYWKWIKGLPVMLRVSEMEHILPVRLTSGYDLTSGTFGPVIPIRQLDPFESNKTLGVRQATTGDDKDQCEYLRGESIRIANLTLQSNFTKFEAYTAYSLCYIPFVTYSLGTTTLSHTQLHSISTYATSIFLTRMGFNRHFPRAIAYGPTEFGGLALRDLKTEQGVLQIKLLMEHVYHSTSTGNMIIIALQTLQMEAGISKLLLTELSQPLPYITNCWITSLRAFMFFNNIALEFASTWNHCLTRKHDTFIMDIFLRQQYSPMQLRHLNAVRLYLQVATVAEIASADGLRITETTLSAVKSTTRISLLPNWIRQPEITSDQRVLWKSAVHTHLLRANSTNLIQPLGEWTDAPTQRWPGYYDPTQKVLLRYDHAHSIRVHQEVLSTTSRPSRKYTIFSEEGIVPHSPLDPEYLSVTIPADIFENPTTRQHQASFATRHHLPTTCISPAPVTISSYTSNLPEFRQRLLAQCQSPNNITWAQVTTTFYTTCQLAGTFECATDGGLQHRQGTFGWVMTGSDIHFQSGAGPVDGDPETSSSTRSEWFGYAGVLEAFLMLDTIIALPPCTVHDSHTPTRPTFHTWIDNKGVADHIQEMLEPMYQPSREYPHDADIISHIQWLWTLLPQYNFTAGWVRSHQDKHGKISITSLTTNAQLNVLADGLATDYFVHGAIRPRAQPSFFPSSKVSLIVNRQRATAQYSNIIRFHVNGTKHKRFLQFARKLWSSEQVWNSIDMQGIGIAFKTLTKPRQHATSKMMHGWWNTGHQRATITKESHSGCPCCQMSDETTEHILRCRAIQPTRARYLATITLKSAGKLHGNGSVTWDILYQGILNWLQYGDEMPSMDLTCYKLHLDQHSMILQALSEQQTIGWAYACRGYLSTKWVEAHSFGKPPDSLFSLRHTWLKQILKALWSFTDTMWAHRNKILHGQEESAKIIRESTVDQRICDRYAEQMEYATSDQVLFDLPLEHRLLRPLRTKKHWLVLAARYHPTTRTRREGTQRGLTQFFTKLSLEHPRRFHRRPASRVLVSITSRMRQQRRQTVLSFE